MQREIYIQEKVLDKFYEKIRKEETFDLINKEGIRKEEIALIGCGDSYSASLILSEIKNVKAYDPYEFIKSENFKHSKLIIITSVSGKTISNIQVAKEAKNKNKKIIVITGNPESKLAKYADKIVSIDYKEPVILPGTLSFTKSLIALYSLFGIELELNISKNLINKAIEEFSGFLSKSNIYYLISAPKFYPVCIYWKAKLSEVLGFKSIIERSEQFAHIDLFNLSYEDAVIFLGFKDERTKRIYEEIKKYVNSKYLIFEKKLPESFIVASIYAQAHSLYLAKSFGLLDFNFSRSDFLKISDRIIY